MRRLASSVLLGVLLLAGCTAGTSPAPLASTTPAAGPTASAAASATPGLACTADYTPHPLPTWATAGFNPPTTPMPYVLSDNGDIVAILWADHDPLLSPPATDQNNKILWVPRVSSPVGAPLLIQATLAATGQTVMRTVDGGPGPSIIDMPAAGCWSFDLTWGVHHDHLELEYAAR